MSNATPLFGSRSVVSYCSSICHIHLKDEDDDNRLGGLSKNHINLALHPLSTTRDTIRLAER